MNSISWHPDEDQPGSVAEPLWGRQVLQEDQGVTNSGILTFPGSRTSQVLTGILFPLVVDRGELVPPVVTPVLTDVWVGVSF